MRELKEGDKVKVIKNNDDEFFDKYIGIITIILRDKPTFGNYPRYTLPLKTNTGKKETIWSKDELQLVTKITNWKKEMEKLK